MLDRNARHYYLDVFGPINFALGKLIYEMKSHFHTKERSHFLHGECDLLLLSITMSRNPLKLASECLE